jgi:hypothetical protein
MSLKVETGSRTEILSLRNCRFAAASFTPSYSSLHTMMGSSRALTALRQLTKPSIRGRRAFTSTFFWATFIGAIATVSLSASTILPCPAKTRRQQLEQSAAAYRNSNDSESSLGQGERVKLTKKGGWIEIE